MVSKHHLNGYKLTILIYGFAPELVYKSLYSFDIDIVVMNNSEKYPNTFEIEMPIDFTENYIQRPANIIFFFVESLEDISNGILQISKTIYWTVKAKFIIYITEKAEIQKIFYLFWWYYSLDCVILEYDTKNVIISEYTPYVTVLDDSDPNQFGCWSSMSAEDMFEGDMAQYVNCNQTCNGLDFDRYSEVMHIQACINIDTKTYDKSLITLKDKTLNLGGYALNLFAVHFAPLLVIDPSEEGLKRFKGKDGYIIKVLADKINLTFKYSTDYKSTHNPQFQTWVNALMLSSYRKYDYYANTVYLLPFSFPALDTTYPVEGSGLCFVIHRAGFIPTWVNLTNMFEMGALIMVTIVFNLTALIYFYFLITSGNKNYFEAFVRSYLYSIQLLLSSSVNWTDKKNSVRIFVFIIFWFIFVVNFIFQGTIVSLLTIPRTDPEINTFQELYDTGYVIEGYPSPDAMLPATSDLYKGINKRFRGNTKMFSCMNELKQKVPKACWMDCMIVTGFSKSERDAEGRRYIHIGQDRVHSHHLVYPLSRNNPLKPRFDYYIKILFESGILNQWRNFKRVEASDGLTDNKVLNLDDIKGCFYILFFGYFASLVSFILEWMIHALNVLKRNYKKILNKMANLLRCCTCRKSKKI